MTAGGEALQLALGLLRSPAHRRALQGRPLPGGMTELLEVASGSDLAQQSAAARMRASPGHLQEAARFFVQQVLFTDHGDAYRVLGTDARATDALLRSHHRLLLRWLHPDRNPGAMEWETTFAHRVNQAWNQLRTPALRHSYDGSGHAAAVPQPGRPVGIRLPAGVAPVAAADAGGSRLAPSLVLLLAVLCLLLAWLAVRGDRRMDDWDQSTPAGRDQRPAPVASPASAQSPSAVSGSPPVEAPPAERRVTQAGQDQGPAPVAGRGSAQAAPAIPAPPVTPATYRPARADVAAAAPVAVAAAAPPFDIDEATGRRFDAALASLPVLVAGAVFDPPGEAVVASERALGEPDPLQLLREADATVAHLARYLASPTVAPPNWSAPGVESSALALRNALEARVAVIDQAELALNSPNWLFGSEVATLNTAYQLEHAGGTLETGLLHVRLERGADGWQVATVQLEPAR